MTNSCRTCSKYAEINECVGITFKINEDESVLDLLEKWASIKVIKDDKLPQIICKICFISVKSFTNFVNVIRKSDQKFKELLNLGDNSLDTKQLDPLETTINHITENELNINNSNNVVVSQTRSQKKDEVEQKSSPFECITCQETFKKLYQYKTHMNLHTGERKYSCKICGKSFARKYVLTYHIRVHTGEKKFVCNFCNKSFIHPSNLYKHKKIHTNTRKYKCELCSKAFIESEALKIHVRRIHTGEKPFLCEICSKSFSCQSALGIHKQDTHLQKVKCPVCKNKFSSRILKHHMKLDKIKDQEIKTFICDQCGKNYSSEHNLRQHLLTHQGIKPYATQPIPCPICNKLYSKRRIKSHNCMSENA